MRLSLMFWLMTTLCVSMTSCRSEDSDNNDTPPAENTNSENENPENPNTNSNNNPTTHPDDPGSTLPGEIPPEPPAPAPEPDPLTAECETSWAKYVENNKVGTVTSYETTVRTTGAGGVKENKRLIRETVTGTEENAINIERVEKDIEPAEGEERKSARSVTRDGHCQNIANANDPEVKMEVLEQKTETLKVGAGSFETNYTKSKHTGADDEYVSEIWTSTTAPEITVKAIGIWRTKKNGAPFTQQTTTILTELKVP